MLRLQAMTLAFFASLAAISQAGAMTFSFHAPSTIRATGEIVAGDAARFAALQKFTTLELDSPGGSVGEALRIAENMDQRGKIRTVVRPGASCASACAMALFVSGSSRVVYMGGRVGIHSCATQDGTAAPECNSLMAANATAHGVPWGVIEGFGNATKPSEMLWLSAEDAECWGMMKWSETDTSNNGIACFLKGTMTGSARTPADVNAANADDITCRMAAPTSRIYVPGGKGTRGFSDAYRSACERVARAPTTPKYAAIDILLWLSLTDPNVMAIKPGTTMFKILDQDASQVSNCWKCLTIMGMSEAMHGYQGEGLTHLQSAVDLVRKQTGSVPQWLVSRVQAVAADVPSSGH